MSIFKKEYFSRINLINILIGSLSFTLIIGNLATNINIILIIILGFATYKFQIFNIKNTTYKYLIFFFFFYLILITFINNFSYLNSENFLYKEHLFKSFAFLRFLLLFLVINKLLEQDNFNFKIIIYFFSFFSLIISFDLLYQVIFKVNIFKMPITLNKPSSFFGDENIAGGYLQKFILFPILLLNYKFNKKNSEFFLFFLFFSFLVPIYLTSNRISVVLFIISILLFFLLQKSLKKTLLTILFFLIINVLVLKSPFENRYTDYYYSFVNSSINIIKKSPKLFLYGAEENETIRSGSSGYLITFYSGVQLWKEKKIFGSGIKSFRINCKFTINTICNTHPHNYTIELLLDTGLLGFFTIYFIFLIGLFNFIKFYFSNKNLTINSIPEIFYLVTFLITFIEFFPIRSSGSFFTTNNASIIFFMLAIFLNFKKIKNSQ